jgi:hypothetical protein
MNLFLLILVLIAIFVHKPSIKREIDWFIKNHKKRWNGLD